MDWKERAKVNVEQQKSVVVKELSVKKIVTCRVAESPLLWHPLEIKKIYLVNNKDMFAICPQHPTEVIPIV